LMSAICVGRGELFTQPPYVKQGNQDSIGLASGLSAVFRSSMEQHGAAGFDPAARCVRPHH